MYYLQVLEGSSLPGGHCQWRDQSLYSNIVLTSWSWDWGYLNHWWPCLLYYYNVVLLYFHLGTNIKQILTKS
jgi:hypothetical protein